MRRNIFIRFFTVMVVAFSAMQLFGGEYIPMIRQDRIWECISHDEPDLIKCVKIGNEIDINGKTYRQIITFRKTDAINCILDSGLKGYKYATTDGLYESEGYMREEDGKVYTLVDKSYYLLKSITDINNMDDISEVLIYDFNVSKDDEIELYTFCAIWGCEPCKFKVLDTDMVKIDNEDCRRIKLMWLVDWCGTIIDGPESEYIEGIGVTDRGCLNYHEIGDQVGKIWYKNFLCRVFDSDGNVVYKNMIYESIYGDLSYDNISSVSEMQVDINYNYEDSALSFGKEDSENVISIYDVNGRKTASASGIGRIRVSTDGLRLGVYVVVFESDGKTAARKKFIVK